MTDIKRRHRISRLMPAAKKWAAANDIDPNRIIPVRHVTFDELSREGYDIQRIKDGAEPINLVASAPPEMSMHWKHPMPIIEPTIATLRGATLLRDGSVLLPGGLWCFLGPTFTGGGSNWYKRPPPRGLITFDPATNGACMYWPEDRLTVQGRCFSARHSMGGNYGQFVHDVLTRIYYEDLGVLVPGRDKVIAPEFPKPMQKALFDKVFSDYEIVRPPVWMPLDVEELLLPANLCTASHFNPAGIASLANRLRRIMTPYVRDEKHMICVSRRDGRKDGRRDFVSEEPYESMMRNLGFLVVEVSTLEPEAQFALWANTTHIVGIHGAGMMNMIMMPRGNYTEITDRSHCHLTARCAMAAGHQVSVIPELKDSHNRLMIDLDRLQSVLSKEH